MHTYSDRLWQRAFATALVGLAALGVWAQIMDEDLLRRITLPPRNGVIASMEVMPDGHTLVLGISKGGGLVFVDTVGWAVVRELPLTGFVDGPRTQTSLDGRRMHLAEQFRWAAATNKDYRGDHAVIDPATGKEFLRVGGALDAAMNKDGERLAALVGGTLTLFDVATGNEVLRIPVERATNAVAISPDGRHIVVSHVPSEAQLAQVPSVRNDKKAIKAALKFRQMLSVYDADNGTLVALVPEIYDVVRSMRFTVDGKRLLVLSTSDPRMAPDVGRGSGFSFNYSAQPGHVDQVDMATLQPLRTGFMSRMSEPFLAVDPAITRLALSNTEGRNKRKLLLYDLSSGETLSMVDLEQRRSSDKGEGEEHDGRLPYCWTPDGRLLVGQGDHIGIWAP